MRFSVILLQTILGATVPAGGQPHLAITPATVFDPRTGQMRGGLTILIEGERIVAVGPRDSVRVPESASVIDGTDVWVVPGLVDVHVHSTPPAILQRALALGVTSIHLMPSAPAPRDSLRATEARSYAPSSPMPRLHITSPLFTGKFPGNVMPGARNFVTPQSAAEATKRVAELRAEGFRSIKIIQDDGTLWTSEAGSVPRLAAEVFRALAREARRLDMRVYAHVAQVREAELAIAEGVNVFVHGIMDSVLSDALWRRMREAPIVWAPAIARVSAGADARAYAHRVLADNVFRQLLSAEERKAFEAATAAVVAPAGPFPRLVPNGAMYLRVLGENTRAAQRYGVPIAVGADASGRPGVGGGGGPGIGTHIELELLQQAGLTPAEALTSATYGGALALGADDELGTVAPGKLADLVVLARDPLVDVRNLRDIAWVIKGGKTMRPADLRAASRD